MLESLTIRNYAIIDEFTAEFAPGLTIITGETGAGKSIVVDALELVLGARASSDIIRAGTDRCEVGAVFTVDRALTGDDFPVEPDDGQIILRREVRADGNNRCYCNDHPVTLRTLKELGDQLVDFHGQHDHQSLLAVSLHVGYLDGYGQLGGCAGDVRRLYGDLAAVRKRIRDLRDEIESDRRDRELYTFQVEEIDAADLKPGEDDKLLASIGRLSRAEELKTEAMALFETLSESEDAAAVLLGELAGRVTDMARWDESLAPHVERLAALVDGVEEEGGFFRGYAERIENDPALLAEFEERLALVERLRKKYGGGIEDVLAYRDTIHARLERTERTAGELDDLEIRIAEIRTTLAERARALSAARKEAAPRLSAEVEGHLAELGMRGARLIVAVEPVTVGAEIETDNGVITVTDHGMDRVELMLAANPGEPPRPLVKVASGGEVSRVMLALKLALVDAAPVPTMVFDEIDAGVSGRVGDAVGRKLARLTAHRQALVITHLPQIAALADLHFSARKTERDGRTSAGLVLLDDDARRRELASLLSGEAVTDTALAHAAELLENSRTGNRPESDNTN